MLFRSSKSAVVEVSLWLLCVSCLVIGFGKILLKSRSLWKNHCRLIFEIRPYSVSAFVAGNSATRSLATIIGFRKSFIVEFICFSAALIGNSNNIIAFRLEILLEAILIQTFNFTLVSLVAENFTSSNFSKNPYECSFKNSKAKGSRNSSASDYCYLAITVTEKIH